MSKIKEIARYFSPFPGDNKPEEMLKRFAWLQSVVILNGLCAVLALTNQDNKEVLFAISAFCATAFTSGLIGIARSLKEPKNNGKSFKNFMDDLAEALSTHPSDMSTESPYSQFLPSLPNSHSLPPPSILKDIQVINSSDGNKDNKPPQTLDQKEIKRGKTFKYLLGLFFDPSVRKDDLFSDAKRRRVIEVIGSCFARGILNVKGEELNIILAVLITTALYDPAPEPQKAAIETIITALWHYISTPSADEEKDHQYSELATVAIREEKRTGEIVHIPPLKQSERTKITDDQAITLALSLVSLSLRTTTDAKEAFGSEDVRRLKELITTTKGQNERKDKVWSLIELAFFMNDNPKIIALLSQKKISTQIIIDETKGLTQLKVSIADPCEISVFTETLAAVLHNPLFEEVIIKINGKEFKLKTREIIDELANCASYRETLRLIAEGGINALLNHFLYNSKSPLYPYWVIQILQEYNPQAILPKAA